MSKPIPLSALITAYGDDKVEFQILDHCTETLNMKNGVTKITFGTEQPIRGFDGMAKLGLVVWLDRERVKQIMAQLKAGAP
jgi:hypothetical protein